jgi:hypothetical protein
MLRYVALLRTDVPLKCQSLQEPHGVTSQKMAFLMKMYLKETNSKVHIGKYLSDNFSVQNDLKQGNALLPLYFSFASEYAIREVLGNCGTETEWDTLYSFSC